jgi:hypothetical protein
MLDKFEALAAKMEHDANSIRQRVGRASPQSQRIMMAEAAALERSVSAIRKQINAIEVDELRNAEI